MNKVKTLLILTPGDPDGIGPEITWKVIQSGNFHRSDSSVAILCVGARRPFEQLGVPIHTCKESDLQESAIVTSLPSFTEPTVWLLPAPEKASSSALPDTLLEGFQVGWSIQKATELVLHKKAAALVTGPISKDRLQKGGYVYTGHTDFLADLCKVPHVTMMLANSQLRVTLVTTHISIRNLSDALDRQKIRRTVLQTIQGLTQYWGIARPRIAVAALNPHAGENGLFGKEDIEVVEPEIIALQKEGYDVVGPLPSDTLFAKHIEKEHFDAVVCMYHDQGLIPVKLLDFYGTVNITLGLPMIRTSVDHGVGFDIAGKGIANPSSLRAAIDLAAHLASIKK